MPRPAAPSLCHVPGWLARAVAILAMLLQVVLAAEHLGAAAVHDLQGGERLGFLQLCTGAGEALLDPVSGQIVAGEAAQGPASQGHGGCAICSSASICAFAMPEIGAVALPHPTLLTQTEPAPPARFAFIAPLTRSGLIRAPPQA